MSILISETAVLSKDALNTPALLPRPLGYFLKREEQSPPGLSPAPVLVFIPDLVNTSLACSPHAPWLLHNIIKAAEPDSAEFSLPRTYYMSHLCFR